MNIVQRVQAPTPYFFKVLRAIGLSLAFSGGTIIGAGTVPDQVKTVASYVIIAGSVMAAVSQTTVENKQALP